jgi:hypothetical protein
MVNAGVKFMNSTGFKTLGANQIERIAQRMEQGDIQGLFENLAVAMRSRGGQPSKERR